MFPVEKKHCNITGFEALNHDVFRVRLRLETQDPENMHYHAGQYLDLCLPEGKKASFSIASAPDQGRDLELHIRQVPGSEFNAMILETLRTQSEIDVELPKGTVYLSQSEVKPETRFIFAAASTGFAQIKSMVEHLLANQAGNPIEIYWGARVEADMYLEKLPQQWAAEHANVSFIPVVSEPENSPGWQGRTGLMPDALADDLTAVDADLAVYACGSPGMVHALVDRLEAKGVAEEQIHSDVFAWAPRPEKTALA
ncbi:NAD(P)H-flavin reductase [Marinobacterium sediminicola]|uniref:CDP-4-dehydro-6-deoxyglucose reductase n=1 Tax=Marinobacterium sediminicola TaxID=518898 RepID=A0ABY1S1R7_9GAMM|nr:NAD(P)H-flavin reductase [Marinobacterium sediminicola]ULG69366.1 NAD(P)H-flavin reductase [Marinobacterium sediminicola]SMR75513.1 CDP-4-dehydro-6-deoxyglucose reductase [Marinobacterium sediminicola]